MAEEYDPLQKMGQGNAYDGLVAGRTSKLKKAAAASAFPVGIVVYIVIRLLLAGVSTGNRSSHQDSQDTLRALQDLQRQLERTKDRPLGVIFPEDLRNGGDPLGRLRQEIKVEKLILQAMPPGPGRQAQERQVANLEAQLKQLEAEAGLGPNEPEPVANPVLVGPPEELKGPLKR